MKFHEIHVLNDIFPLLSFQIAPYQSMVWTLPATSKDLKSSGEEYKTLPYGRTATVNLGSHCSVFVLTQGRCVCSLSKAWHDGLIHVPKPDMDVRVYSDSEHDAFDPKNKELRDAWFSQYWPALKRHNKAEVGINFIHFLFCQICIYQKLYNLLED